MLLDRIELTLLELGATRVAWGCRVDPSLKELSEHNIDPRRTRGERGERARAWAATAHHVGDTACGYKRDFVVIRVTSILVKVYTIDNRTSRLYTSLLVFVRGRESGSRCDMFELTQDWK